MKIMYFIQNMSDEALFHILEEHPKFKGSTPAVCPPGAVMDSALFTCGTCSKTPVRLGPSRGIKALGELSSLSYRSFQVKRLGIS